jgi:hypothetical protein
MRKKEQNDQVHIESVEVEITDDLFENSVVPLLEIEDEDLRIEYQGAIITWLQREYGEHLEVIYTLYQEYLAARNEGRHCYRTHRASLSNLILLNPVIKRIVHDDAWYLPKKIQNLTTSASLIFAGQCCVFKYQTNTMSSKGGGFFN